MDVIDVEGESSSTVWDFPSEYLKTAVSAQLIELYETMRSAGRINFKKNMGKYFLFFRLGGLK